MWFRSKERPRNGTGFSALAARRMEREPPRSFTRPIFSGFLARSLTLSVPRSLLQNRTERFATQARGQYEFNGDKFLTPAA